ANIKGEILSNYLNKALNLKDENVNLNNTNLNYTNNTNTKDTLLSNLDKFNSQDMSKSGYHFYFKHLYQFTFTFLITIFRYFKKISSSL
uniref:hypothetical protein n=1 Tax=uncultured Campylobacter sp. TaxID=218934 RepID=UPI00261CB97A